jgi:segregation and condensation protein A
VFTRGDPEAIKIVSSSRLTGNLYELVQAYVDQRRKDQGRTYQLRPPQAYPLDDARLRLRHKLPDLKTWTELGMIVPQGDEVPENGPSRASYMASTLSAGLELVKEGALEAQQKEAFAALYLRARLGERQTQGEAAA